MTLFLAQIDVSTLQIFMEFLQLLACQQLIFISFLYCGSLSDSELLAHAKAVIFAMDTTHEQTTVYIVAADGQANPKCTSSRG